MEPPNFMLDLLSSRLKEALNPFKQTPSNGLDATAEAELVQTVVRNVRRALLEADVSLRAVKTFISRFQDGLLDGETGGLKALPDVEPEQQVLALLHQELTALLGKEASPLALPEAETETPTVWLLFGLQGSGKTTTAAKLALQQKNGGQTPLLVAADTHRPAAIDQLQQLGQRVGVPVFTLPGQTEMGPIVEAALSQARAEKNNLVIVDTAGRLEVDTALMADLLLLERVLASSQSASLTEKLLVMDAMVGQQAVGVAEAFETQLGLTGVILTKLDGDARGGVMLSVVEATGRPIKLVGTGETPEALEIFHPERMAGRLLGLGDVATLVERAQSAFDEKQSQGWEAKLKTGQFGLNDFLSLQKTFGKLGSMGQILGMLPIPGIDQTTKDMLSHTSEGQFKKLQVMVSSMTALEREKPELITGSRLRRIAKGCGQPQEEISAFLKQFNQMRMMMGQMMQLFGGGGSEPALQTAESPSKGGFSLSMPGRKKKKEAAGMDFFNQMAGGGAFGNKAGKKGKKGGFPQLPKGFPPNFPGGAPGGMPPNWPF